MILPNTLKTLTSMNSSQLSRVLDTSGYSMCSFKSAEFLGITNGGDFCYKVVYHDESGEGEDVGKVFVKYDHATQALTADF